MTSSVVCSSASDQDLRCFLLFFFPGYKFMKLTFNFLFFDFLCVAVCFNIYTLIFTSHLFWDNIRMREKLVIEGITVKVDGLVWIYWMNNKSIKLLLRQSVLSIQSRRCSHRHSEFWQTVMFPTAALMTYMYSRLSLSRLRLSGITVSSKWKSGPCSNMKI